MKAAVLRAAKTPMTIEEVQLDNPAPDEVRVRVAASGLCHSDYHVVAGDLQSRFPVVLGHEPSGIVESVGERVSMFKPGDHVVACISGFCGHCNTCVQGFTYRCTDRPARARTDPPRMSMPALPDGKRLHVRSVGGFADTMLVHQNSLVKVPREIPLDRACILGCAVITGYGAVNRRAKVPPGSTVAVIGCGGVGLSAIQGARLAGAARIIAVDIEPTKLEMAKRFGATDAVMGGDDAPAAVVELTKGGVDYVFEVLGTMKTIQQGCLMLGAGGTLTIVGVPPHDAKLTLPGSLADMFMKEVRIQWTYMGSSPFTVDIPRLADFYLQGKLELDAMISNRIRLEDINAGFETMIGGRTARNVIVFEDVMKEAARAA